MAPLSLCPPDPARVVFLRSPPSPSDHPRETSPRVTRGSGHGGGAGCGHRPRLTADPAQPSGRSPDRRPKPNPHQPGSGASSLRRRCDHARDALEAAPMPSPQRSQGPRLPRSTSPSAPPARPADRERDHPVTRLKPRPQPISPARDRGRLPARGRAAARGLAGLHGSSSARARHRSPRSRRRSLTVTGSAGLGLA